VTSYAGAKSEMHGRDRDRRASSSRTASKNGGGRGFDWQRWVAPIVASLITGMVVAGATSLVQRGYQNAQYQYLERKFTEHGRSIESLRAQLQDVDRRVARMEGGRE